MRVYSYLQIKYGTPTPQAILNVEANIFGIPLPLEHGWIARYKNVEITEPMMYRLYQALGRKNKKNNEYTNRALALVSGHVVYPLIKDAPMPTSSKKQKKNARKLARQIQAIDNPKPAAPRRVDAPRLEDNVRKFSINSSIDPNGDDFLQSFEWRSTRMLVIKKHGARCMCCGATPSTGAVMNVDHIKPRKLFPELALSLDNLQILCHECNHGKGNWDMTDWRNGSAGVFA